MMNLSPWRCWEIVSPLSAEALIHDLAKAPQCGTGWNVVRRDLYFCGAVDVFRKTFRLHRNIRAKYRAVYPVLTGAVETSNGKTVLRAAIRPALFFWFALAIPAFLGSIALLGLVLWLAGALREGQLAPFLINGFLGIAITGWLWASVLLLHYVSLKEYRQRFENVVQAIENRRAAERGA
jgi:hypothetical protein